MLHGYWCRHLCRYTSSLCSANCTGCLVYQIQFKVLVITFKALYSLGPTCLWDYTSPHMSPTKHYALWIHTAWWSLAYEVSAWPRPKSGPFCPDSNLVEWASDWDLGSAELTAIPQGLGNTGSSSTRLLIEGMDTKLLCLLFSPD